MQKIVSLILEKYNHRTNNTLLITPRGNHDRAHAPEIIEIRENKRENRWEIDVRRARLEDKLDLEEEEIAALFSDVAEGEIGSQLYEQLSNFWEAIDQELMQMRIPAAVAERQQKLGITDTEIRYWQLPSYLSDKQNAVLCYFLPHAEEIKESPEDIAHCFSIFLETEISVELKSKQEAEKQFYASLPLHAWKIGLNSIVGGYGQAQKPTYVIKINCPSNAVLQAFLPQTRLRNLLEQVLIPHFIGDSKNTEIQLEAGQNEEFIIGKNTGIVNFCTVST